MRSEVTKTSNLIVVTLAICEPQSEKFLLGTTFSMTDDPQENSCILDTLINLLASFTM